MHLLGLEYAPTGLALAGYRGHGFRWHIKRRPSIPSRFTPNQMQVSCCRCTVSMHPGA